MRARNKFFELIAMANYFVYTIIETINEVVKLSGLGNEFGEFLKDIRKQRGYKTQKHLADVSGVSQTTLSRIEAGIQKPLPETIKMLAPHLQPYTYEKLMEKAGYFDDIKDIDSSDSGITIAAHHDGDDWTKEELEEIKKFMEFIKSKRQHK